MVAEVGDNAAAYGSLAPIVLQRRPGLRQESIAAGGAGVRLCWA